MRGGSRYIRWLSESEWPKNTPTQKMSTTAAERKQRLAEARAERLRLEEEARLKEEAELEEIEEAERREEEERRAEELRVAEEERKRVEEARVAEEKRVAEEAEEKRRTEEAERIRVDGEEEKKVEEEVDVVAEWERKVAMAAADVAAGVASGSGDPDVVMSEVGEEMGACWNCTSRNVECERAPPNRSCKRCTSQKRRCALTEEETKSRGKLDKGKGKEEEAEPKRKRKRGVETEPEPEWVGRLERRLERLEKVVRTGLQRVVDRVEELLESDAEGDKDE